MFSGWSLHTFGHIVFTVVCGSHIQFSANQVLGTKTLFTETGVLLVLPQINE